MILMSRSADSNESLLMTSSRSLSPAKWLCTRKLTFFVFIAAVSLEHITDLVYNNKNK